MAQWPRPIEVRVVIPGLIIDVESDVPVYRQIAEGVLLAAEDGRLQNGRRLPPTRDLARQLGVNRNTVVAAYDHLAAEGRVHSQTGKGTFLTDDETASADAGRRSRDARTWFTAFSRAVDGAALDGLQAIYGLALTAKGISFVGSYPTRELMPIERFRAAINTALDESGAAILSYGASAGYVPLRRAIAERMRGEGSPVDPGDLLITNGAQQALELVFRCLLDPGDVAVTEEPTYTGALSVLGSLGARVVGVPLDDDGIRPDLLAVALERHRPRLVYLQPTFQNPTTIVMSEARRREVLAVTERFRCPVIEDDWAGDLRFEGRTLPSLHALDGGRHVVQTGTFSKKLMPGLRVGWVAAPPPMLERLVGLKRVQDCGSSPLVQAALHVFLREGGLDEHLERVRPAYRERRDLMLAALERHFPAAAHWTRPEGGLFIWVTLPAGFDGNELFVAARQRGVLYSRGDLFHRTGSGRNMFRLTYSTATHEQIEQGVRILGELVSERLTRSRPTPQGTLEAVPIL